MDVGEMNDAARDDGGNQLRPVGIAGVDQDQVGTLSGARSGRDR